LTGGVLWRGWSNKDLDIALYPRDKGKPDRQRVEKFIKEWASAEKVHGHDYSGEFEVWKGYRENSGKGKPIDFFFFTGHAKPMPVYDSDCRRIIT